MEAQSPTTPTPSEDGEIAKRSVSPAFSLEEDYSVVSEVEEEKASTSVTTHQDDDKARKARSASSNQNAENNPRSPSDDSENKRKRRRSESPSGSGNQNLIIKYLERIESRVLALEQKNSNKRSKNDKSFGESSKAEQENGSDMEMGLSDVEEASEHNQGAKPDKKPKISEAVDFDQDIEASIEDLLSSLGDEISSDPSLGPPIQPEVAVLWERIVKRGITEENLKKLISKYPAPKNFPSLVAPKLNGVIRESIKPKHIEKDDRLTGLQNRVCSVMSALGSVLTQIVKKEEINKKECLDTLSDAGLIMADMFYQYTDYRRNMTKYTVKIDWRDVLEESTADEWLYGKDLDEKLRNKIAMQILSTQLGKAKFRPKPESAQQHPKNKETYKNSQAPRGRGANRGPGRGAIRGSGRGTIRGPGRGASRGSGRGFKSNANKHPWDSPYPSYRPRSPRSPDYMREQTPDRHRYGYE